MSTTQEHARFIWSVADLLRGDYKPHEYGQVILPLTVIRRLDAVLAPTKAHVLRELPRRSQGPAQNINPLIMRDAGQPFYNISRFDLRSLLAEPNDIAANLTAYINGFSANAREILEYFSFAEHIARLDRANLLYLILQRFADIDLHPDRVSNSAMGYLFEELIRRFAEQSNETAGEHFTPREVIRLMVNLLFVEDVHDPEALQARGAIRTLYDPAAGTGGMLSIAEEYLHDLNPTARLEIFGQELNPESYAICKADMLLKGQNPANIKFGNSFSQDGLDGMRFDYMLSNPPYGVEWKKVEQVVREEHEKRGFAGRFGAGLPRISDGQLLFLQHMIAKMKRPEVDGAYGSRVAIVMNGSPLFTGGAESGESNIRKWIIENDLLEGIIAVPDQLFYNTGISTYIWVVTNRKRPARRGKVQLVNAVAMFEKMRPSVGEKRKKIPPEQIDVITRAYGEFVESDICKVFDNDAFGYRHVSVERPLRRSFAATPVGIAALKESKPFLALVEPKKGVTAADIAQGQEAQGRIIGVLERLGAERHQSIGAFESALRAALESAGVQPPSALMKAMIDTFGERDEGAEVERDKKGKPIPDAKLHDNEDVPLKVNIHTYFDREVRPFVSDAWIDESKTKIGYEINFTRYFYKFQPLRPLEVIDADIKRLEEEILDLLREVTA